MKKGFTLIELLAVIIILSIISLIAVVSVKPLISDSKTKLSETNIQKIEEIAEAFYINEVRNSADTCIDVSELIDKGYIKGDLVKDPKTGKKIDGSVMIKYEKNKYTYTYRQSSCITRVINSDNEFEYEGLFCEEGSFVYGDVNEDGQITNRDVSYMQQFFEDWRNFSKNQLCAADVNKDKVIGFFDLQIIQAKTNNWPVSLPYEEEIGQTISITYNLNGGTGYNITKISPTFPYSLLHPEKEGYIFIGWTGSNGDTPELDVEIEKDTTGNLEYTANWEKAS